MRADVAAVVPESYAETSWGTPSVDLGAGVRAQLEAARRRGPRREPVHPRVRRPLLLPPRRRAGRPARRPGPAARRRMSRRDEIEAGLDTVRAADRRGLRRRRPGAGRRPAGGGHQVLPGQRRPDPRRARGHRRRREPPPGGRGQGRRVRRPRPARGTSSAGCRATRRPRSRRTPRWSSPSTGASWSARSRRGAHQRSHPVDVLLQVSLDPPERVGSLRRRPRRARRAGGRRRRGRHAHAARPDGGRPARRGPRRGVRQARRRPPRRSSPTTRRRPGSRRG